VLRLYFWLRVTADQNDIRLFLSQLLICLLFEIANIYDLEIILNILCCFDDENKRFYCAMQLNRKIIYFFPDDIF
jgi:hypothetical protein